MRINILALSFLFPNRVQRGYGVFVLNRLKALREYCSLKVIAPIQWYPFINRLKGAAGGRGVPRRDEIDGIEVFHPRFAVIPRYMKWFDGLSYLWSVARVVRQLARRNEFTFDLIDVHWTYPDIVAGYVLARSRSKKFIVTIRGHEALYDQEVSLRRWVVSTLLRRADFVIALSEELREKVIRLGVSPERCRVVLNGVDLNSFNYMDREACRRRLGLSSTSRILLSVGRLTQQKGHHDLISVMPQLSQRGETQLYIIGGVNREEDFSLVLRKMIADLKLDNVHIVDPVPHDELAFWYGAADLFCLATKTEGCPNVVLEALACGTPVVATNVGAIRELITDDENGIVVESNQMSDLGEIVGAALARKWDREQIAARMRARSWASCAEQLLQIYRTILEPAPCSHTDK
jgi:teichuronic acid biosynthesis glycosyltransferase TuaC